MTRHRPPVRPGHVDDLAIAASWYVALPSTALGRGPRPLELFGRQLVAWRDGGGRPVIMRRHCPHLSADLSLGSVVDGQLRCAFHHWRFDSSGACAHVPGAPRAPRAASRPAYPVVERHGFVWAWHGGPEPMFPLPGFPALDAPGGRYLRYRFAAQTPAPPRRVLENAFDQHHFRTVHGVRTDDALQLTVVTDEAATRENGPPIDGAARMGALLRADSLTLPKAMRLLGARSRPFTLLVDGWPGGQRLTFLLDGEVIAKELLTVTPVARGRTTLQGWTLVRRSGRWWRDVPLYLAYRGQHWWGAREDLAIYRDADHDGPDLPTRHDHGVLRFRRHYQEWVDRAVRAEEASR